MIDPVLAKAGKDSDIDGTGCELIERIPGKVSGRLIVRVRAEGIVNSHDMGESIEDIKEDWPSLSVDQIKRLIEFAGRRMAHSQESFGVNHHRYR